VDVASLGELRHALGCGFTPDRILATGPKDTEFLWLCARAGVTVALDSAAELTVLAGLVERFRMPRVRVTLRLSGFESSGARLLSRRSRFGTPVAGLGGSLDAVAARADAVELVGVAYHLDTTGLEEKALALEQCLLAAEECRRRGLSPVAVDVGGGFGVDYLADREQWERYTSALAEAVLGLRPPMTWGGYGYGLRDEGGTLGGALGLYPAHRPVAGPRYLDALLASPAPAFGGRPLGELLLEHLYDLVTEPGRALLDQCGITLARVVEVRRGEDGDLLVRLAAKADDVALEDHGVLLDPVLVPRPDADGDGATAPAPVRAYLFGGLCLEGDLITRRAVHLPFAPRVGDLMAFVNTAGYCMDFHATGAQLRPGARKVAAWRESGAWRWCLDEEYWPTLRGAQ
jgi:diaminopimelate decarboxylase